MPYGTDCPGPVVQCPDGTTVPNGQICPVVSCPDGTTVPNGQTCPVVQCPDGTTVPNGQTCPVVQCPDGTTVPNGQTCPGVPCPDGTSVPNGQTCPVVSCPDGTAVPNGQTCPVVQCLDGTTVPNGQTCPGVPCPDGTTVPNGQTCPVPCPTPESEQQACVTDPSVEQSRTRDSQSVAGVCTWQPWSEWSPDCPVGCPAPESEQQACPLDASVEQSRTRDSQPVSGVCTWQPWSEWSPDCPAPVQCSDGTTIPTGQLVCTPPPTQQVQTQVDMRMCGVLGGALSTYFVQLQGSTIEVSGYLNVRFRERSRSSLSDAWDSIAWGPYAAWSTLSLWGYLPREISWRCWGYGGCGYPDTSTPNSLEQMLSQPSATNPAQAHVCPGNLSTFDLSDDVIYESER